MPALTHYNYKLTFETSNNTLVNYFLKTPHPHNPNRLINILYETETNWKGWANGNKRCWPNGDRRPALMCLLNSFAGCETMPDQVADFHYDAHCYTMRIRTKHGDYFARPSQTYEQIQLTVNDNTVTHTQLVNIDTVIARQPDIKAAFLRILTDAVTEITGKARQTVTLENALSINPEQLSRYGIVFVTNDIKATFMVSKNKSLLPYERQETHFTLTSEQTEIIDRWQRENSTGKQADKPVELTRFAPDGRQLIVTARPVPDAVTGVRTTIQLNEPDGSMLTYVDIEAPPNGMHVVHHKNDDYWCIISKE